MRVYFEGGAYEISQELGGRMIGHLIQMMSYRDAEYEDRPELDEYSDKPEQDYDRMKYLLGKCEDGNNLVNQATT